MKWPVPTTLSMLRPCVSTIYISYFRKETLQPVFDEGISDLDRLNIEREIALFNQFYVYEHKFPQDEVSLASQTPLWIPAWKMIGVEVVGGGSERILSHILYVACVNSV